MRSRLISSSAILAVLISATATTTLAQQKADQITARPISYADLGKAVRSHRGKVIVVDFWSLG